MTIKHITLVWKPRESKCSFQFSSSMKIKNWKTDKEKIEPKIAKNYCWTWTPVEFFRVLSDFLADLLRFHRVTIPTFALSFKILPRMSTRGESKGTRHQWSGSTEGSSPSLWKRRRGSDGGIGAWTVVMENQRQTDKVKERRAESNVRGRGPGA